MVPKNYEVAKLDKTLMRELAESGEKYTVDDVISILKTPDGKLMWLEKGNNSSGLEHIISRHSKEFAERGITDIPKFLDEVLSTKPIMTVKEPRGLHSDYLINGKGYRVAYGTNGYVVSFFPIN